MFLTLMVFEVNWALAAFAGHSAWPWMLVGIVVLLVLVQRCFGLASMPWLGLFAALGIAVDQVLMMLNFLAFDSALLPVFMLLLWVSFALTLPQMLKLMGRFSVPAFALFGPLSYLAAERLGVLSFPQPTLLSLIVLGGIWLMFGVFGQRYIYPRANPRALLTHVSGGNHAS